MTDMNATREALERLTRWCGPFEASFGIYNNPREAKDDIRLLLAALASRGEPAAGSLIAPVNLHPDNFPESFPPLAAPDDWATVEAFVESVRDLGRGALRSVSTAERLDVKLEDALDIFDRQIDHIEGWLVSYLARLRADSHAQTEALERITKLTGYWVQVGQDAQRVAREALGSSPITALAAAAAAPKETT